MQRSTTIPSLPLAACLLALLAPLAAQAEPHMTPGLWEQSFTTKSQSGEMEAQMAKAQAQMAAMPPEQRKMMESMMASRGMSMGPKGTTMRVCITKEQAEREFAPRNDESCKNEIVGRSGNTLKYKFTCTGNPPSNGEGEMTMTSPTSYSGTGVVNMNMNGKPDRMQTSITGKWLGADCGTIKPIPDRH